METTEIPGDDEASLKRIIRAALEDCRDEERRGEFQPGLDYMKFLCEQTDADIDTILNKSDPSKQST